MFKIYANGNFINECLGYGNARELAIRTKHAYGKNARVMIEDIKGKVIETI